VYESAQLQRGKEMGLDERAQVEPVHRRSENDTHSIHSIVESDTVRYGAYNSGFNSVKRS
jgi:hypothetical protein